MYWRKLSLFSSSTKTTLDTDIRVYKLVGLLDAGQCVHCTVAALMRIYSANYQEHFCNIVVVKIERMQKNLSVVKNGGQSNCQLTIGQ